MRGPDPTWQEAATAGNTRPAVEPSVGRLHETAARKCSITARPSKAVKDCGRTARSDLKYDPKAFAANGGGAIEIAITALDHRSVWRLPMRAIEVEYHPEPSENMRRKSGCAQAPDSPATI